MDIKQQIEQKFVEVLAHNMLHLPQKEKSASCTCDQKRNALRLIRAFIVGYGGSMIPLDVISEIARLNLAFMAAQSALTLS